MLRAKYTAELDYKISKDQVLLQQWVYLLSVQAKDPASEGIKEAVTRSSQMVINAANRLIGHPSKKDGQPAVTHEQAMERQQKYLEAMGDQPFSSLGEILNRISDLNSQIQSVSPYDDS